MLYVDLDGTAVVAGRASSSAFGSGKADGAVSSGRRDKWRKRSGRISCFCTGYRLQQTGRMPYDRYLGIVVEETK